MFLNAFLLGGTICVIFQIFLMVSKVDPPRLLIFGFFLGAILTPVGLAPALAKAGQAGIAVLVVNAGQASEGTAEALLAGAPLNFFLVLGLFVVLTLIGICAGAIRASISKK
ncbi:MAG: SpoVA/SpoVAEb family sporulation membrane protein [Spirochaetaceae bacterium]|jgi:uncharacterized membrane protein|nr:SpoVA/SpoVAEb family sporulation membrane protein [Spirochaetaceae bacterium]